MCSCGMFVPTRSISSKRKELNNNYQNKNIRDTEKKAPLSLQNDIYKTGKMLLLR